jgi:hypothetical protein
MTPDKSMNTEPTVEEAVKELHAMFPHTWFFVALRVTWPQGSEMASSSAVIEIADGNGGKADFYDPYLSNCMAAVRQWHEENKQ